jgi:hypothetical protein
MRDREKLVGARKKVGEMSLTRAVKVARLMNRRFSLALNNTGDRGLGAAAMRDAIGRTMEAFEGVEFQGIRFYQCPHSGFVVMKIPPATLTEDFLEMMELAWEGKIENMVSVSGFDRYKLQSIKRRLRKVRAITGRCRCGCGELTYHGKEWLPGHNGRVMGWFRRGRIPPHLIEEFRYWEKNGCLKPLISGNT